MIYFCLLINLNILRNFFFLTIYQLLIKIILLWKRKSKIKNRNKELVLFDKGDRDFLPVQMIILGKDFDLIFGVFIKYGVFEIDTPVFELKEALLCKHLRGIKIEL